MLIYRLRQFFATGERRLHWISIGFLTLCVLLAFPQWYLTGAPGFDDLTRLNAPQRMLVAWFYQHGHMPFWNPFSFGGQPIWAAGQSGPFYLPNVVFLLFPIVTALKVSYLFHELLAAYGMYALVWHISRSRLGAIVSSLAFVTCGFMLGHQIHTQMYDAMSWFPLIFWAYLRLLNQVTPWRMIALSGAIAFEVYAGHPQVTFYVLTALVLYSLLHVIQHVRNRIVWRHLAATWMSVLLSLLLSAPQWLPTLDFISYSNRASTSPWFLLQGSMPTEGPVQFLSPFVFGGGYTRTAISESSTLAFYHSLLFWEFTCYVGIVALALALGAAIYAWRRNEPVRNLFILGVIFATLSMGDNGFMAWALTHLPGFDLFRIPARYIGLTDFCLAALAGVSVGELMRAGRDNRRRLLRWIGWVSLLLLAILVICKFSGPLQSTPSLTFWVPAGIIVLLAIVCFVTTNTPTWFIVGYLATLAITDSVTQSGAFSTYTLVSNPAYTHPSGAVTFVQTHLNSSDPFQRVAALDDSPLSYDQAAAYQIPSLNGYDSLEPDWYANHVNLTWSSSVLLQQPRRLLNALDVKYLVTKNGNANMLPRQSLGIQSWNHWIPNLPEPCDAILVTLSDEGIPTDSEAPLCSVTLTSGSHEMVQPISPLDTRLVISLPRDWPRNQATQVRIDNESWFKSYKVESISLMSGGSLLKDTQLPVNQWFGPAGWKVVYHDGESTVWENPDTLQSAWLTRSANAPLVEEDGGTASKVSWTPNAQTWKVSASRAGYLVVPQMFDPNWKATVDGKSAKVERLGGDVGDVLTGIQILPGNHVVHLTYLPGGFLLAIVLAAGGLFGWIALLTVGVMMRPRTRQIKPKS